MSNKSISELDRNDVEGAMEIYRSAKQRGTLQPWHATMLIQLQDNPDELLRRMSEYDEKAR